MKKLFIILAFIPLISFAATPFVNVFQGGTGVQNIQTGGIVYGNGTGSIATTSQGTAGQILAWLNGHPSWAATTTFNTGLTYVNGNVTCDVASASIAGCLSAANWTTFNNKQAAITFGASSTILFSNGSTANFMATSSIFAPGTNGNVLAYLNGSWQPSATTTFSGTSPVTAVQTGNIITIACSTCLTSNAVTSVFTRTGAVTAQSGDYNTSLITENAANLYFTNARVLAALTGQIVSASNFFATNTAATSTFQGLAFTSATGTNLVLSGSSTEPWFNSASSSIGKLLLANLGLCNGATQKPIVDATGAWTCGVDANSGGSVTDFFTHPINFGVTMSATTTPMSFNGNFYANNGTFGTTSAYAILGAQGIFGSQIPIFDIATTSSSTAATSSVFRINPNGNVGISTTSPWARLSIVATTTNTALGVFPAIIVASSTTNKSLWGIDHDGVPIVAVQNTSNSNRAAGTSTLASGLVTVSTNRIKTGDWVWLAYCMATTTSKSSVAAALAVKTITNGVSFVASSSSNVDNRDICWEIHRPSY